MIQRAKDAQVVGIVVGTLGVGNYSKLIHPLLWINFVMKSLLLATCPLNFQLFVKEMDVLKSLNMLNIGILELGIMLHLEVIF